MPRPTLLRGTVQVEEQVDPEAREATVPALNTLEVAVKAGAEAAEEPQMAAVEQAVAGATVVQVQVEEAVGTGVTAEGEETPSVAVTTIRPTRSFLSITRSPPTR